MKSKIDRITIKGIDLSRSQSVTADGSCSEIVNARPVNGAWRNMYNFNKIKRLPTDTNIKIIYIHPVIGSKGYIALEDSVISYVDISENGQVQTISLLCREIDGYQTNVTHFEKILIFSFVKEDDVLNKYFIYKNGEYVIASFDNIEPIQNVSMVHLNQFTEGDVATVTVDNFVSNNVLSTEIKYDQICYDLHHINDVVTGVVYIMFAYRLFDGSIIKNSNIYPLSTEGADAETKEALFCRKSGNNKYVFSTSLSGCRTEISINIPIEVVNNPLVESIVILSTRNMELFDFDDVYNKYKDASKILCTDGSYKIKRSALFSNDAVEAMDTPFYTMYEITIVENKTNYSVTIGYKNFYESIIHNEVFMANTSVHTIASKGMFEYNNRLHRYDVKTKLYGGAGLFNVTDNFLSNNLKNVNYTKYIARRLTEYSVTIAVYMKDDMQEKVVYKHNIDICHIKGLESGSSSPKKYLIHNNMLSYPDCRAYKIEIYISKNNKYNLIKSFDLKKSISNNYSYYCDINGYSFNGFNVIELPDAFSNVMLVDLKTEDNVITQSNKVMVSSYSNPFFYELKNSYYIDGGNGIIIHQLNCAADQLRESSYGNHPLLLFTSKGIYALEVGSGEMLYSRILFVSKDIILPSTDTISISNIVFFATSQGVMGIQGRKVTKISGAIDMAGGKHIDSLSNYISDSKFCHISCYNELMMYNKGYSYAYVLSLNDMVWYKRQFSGYIINDHTVQSLSSIDSLIEDENGTPLMVSFTTNALKLSNDEYKRVEAVSIDSEVIGSCVDIMYIYGSNDNKNWTMIGSSNKRYIRRTPASFRYIKLSYSVSVLKSDYAEIKPAVVINMIEIESRLRFINHLRDN